MDPKRRKNLLVVAPIIAIMCVMTGIVAYSPTLYRLFCAATGLGGTTQRVDADEAAVSGRTIKVRFDTTVAPGLPWRFEPVQREVTVHLGEQQLVYFTAENLSDQTIVGHAAFNVTPESTGLYFKKVQCFCFTEEQLEPHRKIDMPVMFFVDPALAQDHETRDVNTITLSYTFFRSVKPNDADVQRLSRFDASSAPDAAHGRQLFAERCASCHALQANKIGPMLGGVFGRRAGTAPAYGYSPGLAKAGLDWSAANLDRWLADPGSFIAGARMPVRVLDAPSRKDIIAYLRKESAH
jgi:cytochrome c oxidase assembly protein Cox11